jgi:hypothetical protein
VGALTEIQDWLLAGIEFVNKIQKQLVKI